jgi:hypothetical protein
MKKTLLLFAYMALPFLTFAQEVELGDTELQAVEQENVVEEQQHYMYNVVIFAGSMNNEGFDVEIDDGKEIKKLKGKDGKKIKFKTPAAALMYFISEGWELHLKGDASNPNDLKMTYWVIRKPCTKAEFDKAVKEGIK